MADTHQKIIGQVLLSDADGLPVYSTNGALDVNVVSATPATDVVTYAEVLSVASGATTTVCSYIAPSAGKLKSASAAGTNIAMFSVKLNGQVIAKKYTNFGAPLNVDFNFEDGQTLVANDVVIVEVLHNRPSSGNFNATLITQV